MLALGRGLMAQPRLILLDEPSLGLAPLIVADLFEIVASLRDGSARKVLSTALRAPEGYQRFREAVEALPSARQEWRHFSHESLKARIKEWLAEVSVEPL